MTTGYFYGLCTKHPVGKKWCDARYLIYLISGIDFRANRLVLKEGSGIFRRQ